MAKSLIKIAYKVQDVAQRVRNLATRLDPPSPELLEPARERKVSLFLTSRAGLPFYGHPN